MLSMSIHSGIKGTLTCPSFPSQNPIVGPFIASSSLKQKPSPQKFPTIFYQQTRPSKRIFRLYASATLDAEAEAEAEVEEEAVVAEIPADDSSSTVPNEPAKAAAAAAAAAAADDDDDDKRNLEKPKLVLKFIWMEKNIGLGLDQEIAGHGRVPLSPYFFWPRKDAWEELKTTLESKPWITQKTMIILLNQATDIINLWQQSGGNLT